VLPDDIVAAFLTLSLTLVLVRAIYEFRKSHRGKRAASEEVSSVRMILWSFWVPFLWLLVFTLRWFCTRFLFSGFSAGFGWIFCSASFSIRLIDSGSRHVADRFGVSHSFSGFACY